MSEQRSEIREIVAGGSRPMTAGEIFEQAKLSDDRAAFSVMLSGMAKSGELARHPAPDGSGSGVRFLYGPAASGALTSPAPQRPATSTAPSPSAAPVRETKPKVHSSDAKPAAKSSRKKRGLKKALPVPPSTRAPVAAKPVRWALTDDGAFVLLGSDTEIRGDVARGLVAFVRNLDKSGVV